jgi:hypothetical protein
MSLTDPTSGLGYPADGRFPRTDATQLARNLGRMIDIAVGGDLSVDQDYSIDLAAGTTYRVTMTTSATRQVTLPDPTNSLPWAQVWIRLACNTTAGALEIRDHNGALIVATGQAASVVAGLLIIWTGSAWMGWAACGDVSL